MSDSDGVFAGFGRGGKRDRLVASAADLLYRNGVAATTLADVARAAQVRPGNVYYYFKTKDDLVRAVIGMQAGQAGAMLATLETLPDPAERLKALVRRWDQMRDVIARHGCPFGTLAAEFGRLDDDLAAEADGLIRGIVEWVERQVRHLTSRDARELAIMLFAAVQGGAALSRAMRDPGVMSGQVRHLERWIDTLAVTPPWSRGPEV
ncbi:TetR/AcrR family transcriptional regulator [Actinocrispum wychmicini]|uniref:TetR/AcrR family transcriptional regulator n=1 Tax=Actinocrispum wychmicini TaxID=1213861 RepID=UPI001042F348|nr:TetR/AcrR family transcriptional regulator [Actinocrispum wychmicini]